MTEETKGAVCPGCEENCSFVKIIDAFKQNATWMHSVLADVENIKYAEFVLDATNKRQSLEPYIHKDEYGVIEHASGRYVSTPTVLHATIDYYILSYCRIKYRQARIRHPENDHYFEDNLNDAIGAELGKQQKRRKYFPHYWPIDLQKGSCLGFAWHATQELLCKKLLLRRNATAQEASVTFHKYFFDSKSVSVIDEETSVEEKAKATAKERTNAFRVSNEKSFEIEDYFAYECFTGASLAVELTAALMQVVKEDERRVIWNRLNIDVLPSLVASPMFFARNMLARCYVIESSKEIEDGYRRFINYGQGRKIEPLRMSKEQCDECISIAVNRLRPILDGMYVHNRKMRVHCYERMTEKGVPDDTHEKAFFLPQPVPACCIELSGGAEIQRLSFLKEELASINRPVNIVQYCENPKNGPLAFCNVEHPGVMALLKSAGRPQKGILEIKRNREHQAKLFQEVYLAIQNEMRKNGTELLRDIFQ